MACVKDEENEPSERVRFIRVVERWPCASNHSLRRKVALGQEDSAYQHKNKLAERTSPTDSRIKESRVKGGFAGKEKQSQQELTNYNGIRIIF